MLLVVCANDCCVGLAFDNAASLRFVSLLLGFIVLIDLIVLNIVGVLFCCLFCYWFIVFVLVYLCLVYCLLFVTCGLLLVFDFRIVLTLGLMVVVGLVMCCG